VKLLEDLQAKYRTILDSGKIEEVLRQGKEKAQVAARKKLMEVQRKIGADI